MRNNYKVLKVNNSTGERQTSLQPDRLFLSPTKMNKKTLHVYARSRGVVVVGRMSFGKRFYSSKPFSLNVNLWDHVD